MIKERELQLQLEIYNKIMVKIDNELEKVDRTGVEGIQCRNCRKNGHLGIDC